MNMQAMLKQAQQMQKQMLAEQEKIASFFIELNLSGGRWRRWGLWGL